MSNNLQPHIRLGSEDKARYALLPGDPGRVDRFKNYLEDVRDLEFNREYKSISGSYKGVRLIVLSTGIGGPSTCIAVEELKNIGVEVLIRVGSCGALQGNIKLGDLIIPSGAVRNEGTSDSYVEKGYPAVPDFDVLRSLIESAGRLGFKYHCGRVRSHDSFYTDSEDDIDSFWSRKGILGADMESSPLFVIGGLRGLKTGAILNSVVEYSGSLESGINDYVDGENAVMDGERKEIITALEAIASLDKFYKGEL